MKLALERSVLGVKSDAVCCDRCPGGTNADTYHFARRRRLKAAVFQPLAALGAMAATDSAGVSVGAPTATTTAPDVHAADRQVYRTVTGTIIDVSPHFITIGDGAGSRRMALTADATAWRGEPLEPSALTPGDEAVVRIVPSASAIADRIWANIGRVCGTIVESDPERLLVAECATKPPRVVVISPFTSVRIKVRLPNLRPGYLVDIIGVRRRGVLHGLIATSPQPPYRGDHLPPRPRVGSRLPEAITGCAVWHDSADEPYGLLGAFYPAVDPGGGCAEDAAAKIAPGQAPTYRELPYLAIGSALHVKNECTNIGWTLPVTGCAPTARLFNDHCIACKTSPRGRIVDLTLASFIALGGELEQGCFNATLTIGR